PDGGDAVPARHQGTSAVTDAHLGLGAAAIPTLIGTDYVGPSRYPAAMTKPANPVPAGYTTVTPWLISKDTAGLIDFLVAAFNAEPLGEPVRNEDGSI